MRTTLVVSQNPLGIVVTVHLPSYVGTQSIAQFVRSLDGWEAEGLNAIQKLVPYQEGDTIETMRAKVMDEIICVVNRHDAEIEIAKDLRNKAQNIAKYLCETFEDVVAYADSDAEVPAVHVIMRIPSDASVSDPYPFVIMDNGNTTEQLHAVARYSIVNDKRNPDRDQLSEIMDDINRLRLDIAKSYDSHGTTASMLREVVKNLDAANQNVMLRGRPSYVR